MLSQEEARMLGHDYIGTEHILLGLMREGDGVGAMVLTRAGAEYPAVRDRVLQLLQGHQGDDVTPAEVRPGELRRAELRFDASGRAGRDIGRWLASLDARLAVIERWLGERLPGAEGQLDRAA